MKKKCNNRFPIGEIPSHCPHCGIKVYEDKEWRERAGRGEVVATYGTRYECSPEGTSEYNCVICRGCDLGTLDDHYLSGKELKQIMKNLHDDAEVFYHRIEDVYFEENNWETKKAPNDCHVDRCGNPGTEKCSLCENASQFIKAYCAWIDASGDLHISAHY